MPPTRAATIRAYSRRQSRRPVIDHNPRRGEKDHFVWYEQRLYQHRGCVERVFARLKDHYGCGKIWVRGIAKVTAHLGFGLLALCSRQIVQSLQ